MVLVILVPQSHMTLIISSSFSCTIYSSARGRMAITVRTPVELNENLSSDMSTDLSISCDLIEENLAVKVGNLTHNVSRSF